MLKEKKIMSPFKKGTYRYREEFTPLVLEGLLRRGYDERQARDYFGISQVTFLSWKHKYPEFAKILKSKSGEHITLDVEAALLKRALGYEYKEVRKELLFDTDKEGNAMKKPKSVKVVETTKHLPADLSAIKMWLLSKDPTEWAGVLENVNITQVAVNNEMPRIVLSAPKEQAKKVVIDNMGRSSLTQDSPKVSK